MNSNALQNFGFVAGLVVAGCVLPSLEPLDDSQIEFKPQSGNVGTTHPTATKPAGMSTIGWL
jgi:hypothetical protein